MRKKITGFFPIKYNGPCVYIINHKSYLDVIILASVIPHKIKYLGKAEVFEWPLFGYLAKHSGQISVKRESKESRNRGYEEMKNAISEGYSIILFPEGGWRNKGDKKSKNPYNLIEDSLLHEFRNGAFRLSMETKVPIIPITLLNAQDRFSDIDMLVRPGDIKLHIFNPIESLEFSDSLSLNKHCNNIMLAKLKEYRNEN
jgi:1-acyl-sn-glycerol-3-phosphate acyltransferase